MFNKKSMVLMGINDDNKKAVLSLEYDGANLNGKVRLYNFSVEPVGILSLGITGNGEVIKAGLTRNSSMFFTFGAGVKSMPDNFSCAIINFVGGQPSPILYGSSQGRGDLEQSLNEVVMSLKNTHNVNEVEEILDKQGIDYEEGLKDEIENEINKCLERQSCNKQVQCLNNCGDCIYKKYFYEHEKMVETASKDDEFEVEEKIEDKEEKVEHEVTLDFYNDIKSQVDVLFAENKAEEYLEQTIPNSKWVKVEFDESGDYYVFGLVYDEDVLKYVCYGVPGVHSLKPPKQLSGYPVWFPVDQDREDGFGYWLSYQDAGTGESVKAIIE